MKRLFQRIDKHFAVLGLVLTLAITAISMLFNPRPVTPSDVLVAAFGLAALGWLAGRETVRDRLVLAEEGIRSLMDVHMDRMLLTGLPIGYSLTPMVRDALYELVEFVADYGPLPTSVAGYRDGADDLVRYGYAEQEFVGGMWLTKPTNFGKECYRLRFGGRTLEEAIALRQGIKPSVPQTDPVPAPAADKPNVDGITNAEMDALVGLVECGPLDDGDMPGAGLRASLLARGLAVRVVVKGSDGFTAATYAGRDAYKTCFGGTTLVQAMNNRQTMLAEKARHDARV